MGELARIAQSQGVSEAVLLQAPRLLHEIAVADARVLDLRTSEQRAAVGITDADISDSDWTICQQIGHAAWFLGLQGIVAPSATGAGNVVTLFEGRIEPGQVKVLSSLDLTLELYMALR
jgi:RES domain-containing protein